MGGIVLIKHCTDKNARQRIVKCDHGHKTISWFEQGKAPKSAPLKLADITEVRKATDPDMSTKSNGQVLSGTQTLRDSMHVAYKNRAFSLIFANGKTLDFQCENDAQCGTLVACF